MPTDSVKNKTFKQIFYGAARYKIPFFQRGYAWEKKQWDQMFLDIKEQIIDEIRSGTDLNDVEHFFGPIVVLEESGSEHLKEFQVIDGQQRITTVYLLLGAIKRAIESKKHLSDEANLHISKIDKFLANDVVDSTDDYLKIKVFSSKGDRLPTYRALFGKNTNPKTPLLSQDQELYIQGNNRVDEFVSYLEKKFRNSFNDIPALVELSEIILNCLKIVWIPLDEMKDDPQAIFESLNDKGMPLRASELLCNYLFQPIIREDGSFEKLHNDQWLRTQTLLKGSDKFEEYLRNLFSIGENKTVGKGRKIYISFKNRNRTLTASSAKGWLSDIQQGSQLYLNIVEPITSPHTDAEIKDKLIKISNTRMESSTPFLLAVLRAQKTLNLPLEVARKVINETYVLLIRRKMTELATTQYDTMFPNLLSSIIHENDIIATLQDKFRQAGVWTSDQDFRSAIISKPLYRERDRPFTRMFLIEVDKSLQTHGQLADYSTVPTIEHTLPQNPSKDWFDYLGASATKEEIDVVLNTAGNLCLLSGPANSSAGRNPFEKKTAGYSEVTALARDIKRHEGIWNADAIRKRSEQIADCAMNIWKWS